MYPSLIGQNMPARLLIGLLDNKGGTYFYHPGQVIEGRRFQSKSTHHLTLKINIGHKQYKLETKHLASADPAHATDVHSIVQYCVDRKQYYKVT